MLNNSFAIRGPRTKFCIYILNLMLKRVSSSDNSFDDDDGDDGTTDNSKDDEVEDVENDGGENQHVGDLYYNPKSRRWKQSDDDN
ncbi:unnamed protein product [Didymodactylos carnosus]|uniref:Uncharacterized protein n=1 Tax=Didymodactylos carnosus TaxID=1234261 RepID=A0A815P0L6_9BILA|nr:unnamed protein product [Didymodactylos carnosus]CAF1439056.1 unnamed protein product [Didymodactylos carnosus]CAF4205858.1 unnamed protein product [Didymodactylos carnosus]CAF4315799.1 unnamed protein product [Didymodactylos carnosus]